MISTALLGTGAAGATPSPAVRVSPSEDGAVRRGPTGVPCDGTGLPGVVARPWAPTRAGRPAGAQHRTDASGATARTAGAAVPTTGTTPGSLPAGAPLS